MVQKVLVRYVDDIDGTEAGTVETVQFAVDGVSYEIDLNEVNGTNLRNAFSDYVANARRVGGRPRYNLSTTPAAGRSRADTEAIRTWARTNGHQISDRGRIPARILDAYAATH